MTDTQPTPHLDLGAIQARCGLAEPGPWYADVQLLIAYARRLAARVAELEQQLAYEQSRLADRALEARELRADCGRAATLLTRDPDGARVLLDRLAAGAPAPVRGDR